MKNLRWLVIGVCFLATILGGTYVQGARDVLFQTSFYKALDKGVAEGEVTLPTQLMIRCKLRFPLLLPLNPTRRHRW